MKQEINLIVNGQSYPVSVDPSETLLDVLRDKLGLTGTKKGCDAGDCGACTVLIDGKCVPSCLTLAVSVRDREIMTIEGLGAGENLHPLQQAFIEHGTVQCGYCIPGVLLTAKALLDENPKPTETEVRHYLSGNLCRCTGYTKIIEAVLNAAEAMGRR